MRTLDQHLGSGVIIFRLFDLADWEMSWLLADRTTLITGSDTLVPGTRMNLTVSLLSDCVMDIEIEQDENVIFFQYERGVSNMFAKHKTKGYHPN